MWLINAVTYKLEDFSTRPKPPYAILSHTWGENETTFKGYGKPLNRVRKPEKIELSCRLARKHKLRYVWVDTCCIDKRSSAELSEAINSMFRWYGEARICFVHLADVTPNDDIENGIRDCRWRTRGWTLQELIAPRVVEFYDNQWHLRGTKSSLQTALSKWTKIPSFLLTNVYKAKDYAVSSIMSWASGRQTSRVEDMAYCLLGLFDVNMPLLYGEGLTAFQRLQEEIIRKMPDLSILAWLDETTIEGWSDMTRGQDHDKKDAGLSNLLATTVGDFSIANPHLEAFIDQATELSLTQQGLLLADLETGFKILRSSDSDVSARRHYFDINNPYVTEEPSKKHLIRLRKISYDVYARDDDQSNLPDAVEGATAFSFVLVAKPNSDTFLRAALARKGGVYVPTDLLPGYRVQRVFPQKAWDVEHRIILSRGDRGIDHIQQQTVLEFAPIEAHRDDELVVVVLVSHKTDMVFGNVFTKRLVDDLVFVSDDHVDWALLDSVWPKAERASNKIFYVNTEDTDKRCSCDARVQKKEDAITVFDRDVALMEIVIDTRAADAIGDGESDDLKTGLRRTHEENGAHSGSPPADGSTRYSAYLPQFGRRRDKSISRQSKDASPLEMQSEQKLPYQTQRSETIAQVRRRKGFEICYE